MQVFSETREGDSICHIEILWNVEFRPDCVCGLQDRMRSILNRSDIDDDCEAFHTS